MAKRAEYEAILEDGQYRRTLARLQNASAGLGLAPGLNRAVGPLNAIVSAAGRLGPLGLAASAAFAGIALGINKALDSFRGFETALARVGATTGQSLAQIQAQYGVLIQDIARQTGIATTDIASGVQKAISGGIQDSEEVALIVQQSARFAAAGFGDLATAISATTTVFANFRESGLNTAEIMDAIAISAQQGEGEVSDFSPAFKRLSGTANLLEIDLNELGGVIANISQTAPSVSEGVTQIEGVMKLLIKPSEQARDALNGIGLSVEGLRDQIRQQGFASAIQTLQESIAEAGPELAGTLFRDFQGVLGIQNLDPSIITAIAGNIETGMGRAIDTAFTDTAQTIDVQLNRLGQTWETGWQTIGSRAADGLAASGFVMALNDLVDESLSLLDEAVRFFSTAYREAAEDQETQIRFRTSIDEESQQRVADGIRRLRDEVNVGGNIVEIVNPETLARGFDESEERLRGYRVELRNLRNENIRLGKTTVDTYSDVDQAAFRGLQMRIAEEKAIQAEHDVLLKQYEDELSAITNVTQEEEKQVMLLATSASHLMSVNASLLTQEERLQANIDKTKELIAEENKRGADTTELEKALAGQQRVIDKYRDDRDKKEEDAEMRRQEKIALDEERAVLSRIDRDRRLVRSRAGPVDETSIEGFDASRRLLLAEQQLAIEEIQTLYTEGTQELADEMEIIEREFGTALDELNNRQRESVQRATEEYAEAFSSIGMTIGDAFSRFEDSTEGWFDLLFTSLPRLIDQFGQLSDAAEGLGSLGGSTGGAGGFLSLLGGFFGGARAEGGPVATRQAYLVGERGPELFVPGRNGQIVNNNQAFGGMNLTMNINGVSGMDASMIRAEIINAVPQIALAAKDFERNARIGGRS